MNDSPIIHSSDLAAMDAATTWKYLATASDAQFPLVWAALMVARDEYPDLDIEGYDSLCMEFAGRLRAIAGDRRAPIEGLRLLNDFLFDELGFTGNDDDYYDPRNSYLNDVLERRTGIPISLGILQLDIAQRVGLTLEGVSFPGHFLVRMPVDSGVLVMDPFRKGRSLDLNELRVRAKPHVGDVDLHDDHIAELLSPASNRAIIMRMLRNLKNVYAEREDWEKALRCNDRLLKLDGQNAQEIRDRGMLYLQVGHLAAARQDLNQYLLMAPHAEDHKSVRNALIESSAQRVHLN